MTIPGRATTPEQKRAVVERILAAWLRAHNLRLGQMLDFAAAPKDVFYVEDERLAEAVEEFVRKPSK